MIRFEGHTVVIHDGVDVTVFNGEVTIRPISPVAGFGVAGCELGGSLGGQRAQNYSDLYGNQQQAMDQNSSTASQQATSGLESARQQFERERFERLVAMNKAATVSK